jgi:hypothetical protein
MTPTELTDHIHANLGLVLKAAEGEMMGNLLEQRLITQVSDFFRLLEHNRDVDEWRVTLHTGAHSVWFTWEIVLNFLDIVIEGSSGNGSFASRQIARSPNPITPPLPEPGRFVALQPVKETIRPADTINLIAAFLKREGREWINRVFVTDPHAPHWDTDVCLWVDDDHKELVRFPLELTGPPLDKFLGNLRDAADRLKPKAQRDAEAAQALVVFERQFE